MNKCLDWRDAVIVKQAEPRRGAAMVRDRELSRSKAVKLPLTFANVPKAKIPEKWQTAAKYRLGGIAIELEELDDWRSVY